MFTKNDLIVGTVTGVLGNIVYAIFIGLKNKADDFKQMFCSIINAEIPLWFFLLMLLISAAIVFLMILFRDKKQPKFLKVTKREQQGLEFQWIWEKDDATGEYEMVDFLPICPQCGKQLRTELYDLDHTYHCSNNHHYDMTKVYNMKQDLVHELRREWIDYADIIEFPIL